MIHILLSLSFCLSVSLLHALMRLGFQVNCGIAPATVIKCFVPYKLIEFAESTRNMELIARNRVDQWCINMVSANVVWFCFSLTIIIMVPAISFTLLHFGPFDLVHLCEFFQFLIFLSIWCNLFNYFLLQIHLSQIWTSLNENYSRKINSEFFRVSGSIFQVFWKIISQFCTHSWRKLILCSTRCLSPSKTQTMEPLVIYQYKINVWCTVSFSLKFF